jgi:hypothetical protein
MQDKVYIYNKDILYSNFKVKLIVKEVILNFGKLNINIVKILMSKVYIILLAINFYI